MNNILMTSGIGQFHTNESEQKKPDKKLTPYLTIGLERIRKLVDKPQQVDKSGSQWLIPSTLPSRNFKRQEENGEYWMLWADLDKNPPTLPDLAAIIDELLGGYDYELYNSRSASVDNQKARLLIPLDKPLEYADWHLAQETLNDKLQALDIIPDRANERAAQLCYLPNKGTFYGSQSKRTGHCFDPIQSWQSEIAAKNKKLEADKLALEAEKQDAMAKREALKLTDDPDLIGAFNRAYTPQDWMLEAGYIQRGNCFRHPHSESGSYSATVKDRRVNALSPNDPLYTNGAGAHDSFSVFCTLFHNGYRGAALKNAGDNLLAIGGLSYNKAQQIEWAKQEQAKNEQKSSSQQEQATGQAKPKIPFSLAVFSLKGQSGEMEKKMLTDTFVLDRIAIFGQATVIYAKPNTGKTLLVLWLLIQAIIDRVIDGIDVFYVNADDNYKGLVNKLKLAERYGFHMLAPGHHGFDSNKLLDYMARMIKEESASGKIIILDTLKKFTNLMDKKTASDFMRGGREFVSNGGTLILLAHTNKNRDSDGKVIFAGTSDIVDDVDCAYTLDEVEGHGTEKHVLFENIKSRGDVAREIGYRYSTNKQSYEDLLDSVKILDEMGAEQAKNDRKISTMLEKNEVVIDAIIEAIEQGHNLKTDLLEATHKGSGISKACINKVLQDHTGKDWSKGHRWQITKGEKNAKMYQLLTLGGTWRPTANDYREVRDGE